MHIRRLGGKNMEKSILQKKHLQCKWIQKKNATKSWPQQKLVGGFNPFEAYQSKWESSPNRDENKKYLKPPSRWPQHSITSGKWLASLTSSSKWSLAKKQHWFHSHFAFSSASRRLVLPPGPEISGVFQCFFCNLLVLFNMLLLQGVFFYVFFPQLLETLSLNNLVEMTTKTQHTPQSKKPLWFPWWFFARNLTWNLKISPWKRKVHLETIIFRFHVKFRGCTSGFGTFFTIALAARAALASSIASTAWVPTKKRRVGLRVELKTKVRTSNCI